MTPKELYLKQKNISGHPTRSDWEFLIERRIDDEDIQQKFRDSFTQLRLITDSEFKNLLRITYQEVDENLIPELNRLLTKYK